MKKKFLKFADSLLSRTEIRKLKGGNCYGQGSGYSVGVCHPSYKCFGLQGGGYLPFQVSIKLQDYCDRDFAFSDCPNCASSYGFSEWRVETFA